MSRLDWVFKDLHSHLFLFPKKIAEINSTEYETLLTNRHSERKIYKKLLHFCGMLQNNIDINVAKINAFTEEDIQSFEDSERVRDLDVSVLLSTIVSGVSVESPVNEVLRAGSYISTVCSLMRSGALSSTEGIEDIIATEISEKAKKVKEIFDLDVSKDCVGLWEDLEAQTQAQPNMSLINTGVVEIDSMLSAIRPAHFGVLAAKTNVGKTAFSLYLTKLVAAQQKVCYISLEMTGKQLLQRLLAESLGVTTKIIFELSSKGKVDFSPKMHPLTGQIEFASLSNKDVMTVLNSEIYQNINIVYLDNSRTVSTVRALLEKKLKEGVMFFIVDYIQKVESDYSGSTPVEVVTALCNILQKTAASYGATIVGCSQFNRTGSEEERPSMYKLKDASTIETSADFIYTLHNAPEKPSEDHPTSYTLEQDDFTKSINLKHVILSLEKDRHGIPGQDFEMAFLGSLGKYLSFNGSDYSKVRGCFNKGTQYLDPDF